MTTERKPHSEQVAAAFTRWQNSLHGQGFASKDVDLVRTYVRDLEEQWEAARRERDEWIQHAKHNADAFDMAKRQLEAVQNERDYLLDRMSLVAAQTTLAGATSIARKARDRDAPFPATVPDSTMAGLDRHRWGAYTDLRDASRPAKRPNEGGTNA